MFFFRYSGWGGGRLLACLCYERGDDWRVKWGVGTEVEAKAPINTLIAAWRGQAVPAKDNAGWGLG